jgi:diguanylate cyclase (GGDEF)-like protein
LRSGRILVVDDEPNIVRFLKYMLTREGHVVRGAADGDRALTLADEFRPDLILLDVQMPFPNGFEVVKVLKSRRETRNIPVILVTARHRDIGSKVKGLSAGADDYITKPFSHSELLARVRAQLRIRELNVKLEDANRRLAEQAVRDSLTGLYNHGYLVQTLEQEFYRSVRYEYALSCTLFDMDRFKAINDTHGHLNGDAVLKSLGALLLENVRKSDTVGRYGGDEFLLIMPHVACAEAVQASERIRFLVEKHAFDGLPSDWKVTLSGGVASRLAPGITDGRTLLKTADEVLYRAKSLGRNMICQAPVGEEQPAPAGSASGGSDSTSQSSETSASLPSPKR